MIWTNHCSLLQLLNLWICLMMMEWKYTFMEDEARSKATQLFALFDTDANGFIDMTEIKQTFTKFDDLDESLLAAAAAEFVDLFDDDGDGQISMQEWNNKTEALIRDHGAANSIAFYSEYIGLISK
eukprot:TRINITY_DN11750_c0_g1_i1.p1 TRINITY_DN11750_c0_g1~~TRINITY_DN11750_c0_g1_i1.p1  ORF type:complete len:126 (-),score=32.48 TRINITY_DN11750_c0_g1_i1:73-450(-)